MLCYVCMFCFLYNARKGILEFLAPIGAQASMNYYVSLPASSCFFKALNLPLDNANTTLSLHPHIALSEPEIRCLVVVQRFILRKLPPLFCEESKLSVQTR